MYLRGDTWHYDFIIGGVRYRGTTGYRREEKKKAEEAIQTIKTQIREKHSIEMIWEQTKRKMIAGNEIELAFTPIWDAFRKLGGSHAGKSRLQTYFLRLRKFCQWMKESYPEITQASEVLPIHAKEWINHIRRQNGANTTKNEYLTSLRMIFATLGKDYGIVENPFSGIKKLPQNPIVREAFTPEELRLIGTKATGWMYSLCLTAISTGLREGDICMLKKSSVNLQTGWLVLQRTRKTGVNVEIPLLPGLQKHLESVIPLHPESEYVFPELAAKYMNSPSMIGPEVKKFFDEIGISDTRQKIDGYKRVLSSKDVHSFRHTFVYLAACHGIPFPVVQGIVGHVSPEMTKHYMDHAGREAKNRYIQHLPDYITGGGVPAALENKSNAQRDISAERLTRIISRITPENLERNRARIVALLQRAASHHFGS